MDLLLRVYKPNKPKIRLGDNFDGGYVIVDDIGEYDFYIGAGIGYTTTFDNSFVEKYNVKGMCFDGTISHMPYLDGRLTFVRKNIDTKNSESTTTLLDEIKDYNNIFLKMDIEWAEWNWISMLKIEELRKFKQIVIEMHSIAEFEPDVAKLRVVEKLLESHTLVHAHGNNGGYVLPLQCGVTIPDVLELTLIRKDVNVQVTPNNDPLPSYIDAPNDRNKPDLPMNYYPFVWAE